MNSVFIIIRFVVVLSDCRHDSLLASRLFSDIFCFCVVGLQFFSWAWSVFAVETHRSLQISITSQFNLVVISRDSVSLRKELERKLHRITIMTCVMCVFGCVCVCVFCVTVAVLGAFKCVLLVSLPCIFYVIRISYKYSCVNRLLIVLRYLTLDSWTPIDL